MAFSLGGVLAGPGVQGLAAILSMIKQNRLTQDYTADQDRQIADALGVASRIGPETLATYDDGSQDALRALLGIQKGSKKDIKALTDQVMGQMGSRSKVVMSDYNAGTKAYGQGLDSFLGGQEAETAGLDSEYQDRYNTAAKDLEGYGNQMKADVDTAYGNQEAAALENLGQRGFGNSTATVSAKLGVERERSAEQRRLGDDLVRQRVGILSGLSGDRLSAKERRKSQTGQYRFGGLGQMLNNNLGRANLRGGLMGDQINALQNLGTFGIQNNQANQGNVANFYGNNANNRANLVGSGLGNYLNTIMGINLVPPPPNQLPFMFGQNSVAPPSAPNFWESAGPGIAQGGMSGLGMLGAAAMLSDRNAKYAIKSLSEQEAEALLRQIESLPVARWKYKPSFDLPHDEQEHIGPMAQDFGAAFSDDPNATRINTVDAIGVLMAAVKALSAEVRDLKSKVAA